MVNFQIMSDLHLETFDEDQSVLSFITPRSKILILAGDIGRIHKYNQLETFLKEVCKHFEIVLYVLGNHEYYKVDNIPVKSMEELLEDVTKIKLDIDNLYILNRTSVIIDDVCIAGCTLWSQAIIDIPQFIVRIPGMNTLKYNTMFKQDLNYIEEMVKLCNTRKLKLVVVTHHCPTYLVGRKRSRDKKDKYQSLYVSNLDYLLDSNRVHTWICGHVHKNFDFYTKNGTRLVCNQKGKPHDNLISFSKEKIISV
jgi:predicted phosphodiesterase